MPVRIILNSLFLAAVARRILRSLKSSDGHVDRKVSTSKRKLEREDCTPMRFKRNC